MKIGFICPTVPGHLNPMTALARHLQARNHEVVFSGSTMKNFLWGLLGSVSGSRLFENDRLALTQYSHLNCDWFEPWRETTDHVSLEICLDGGSRPSPLR